jgi:pyruvate formate lyase activating enzyme
VRTETSEKAPVTGLLSNIQRHATEDGPGIRTTLFFKGCPMHCTWCHNPEAIRFAPELVWKERQCIGARDCLNACPRSALTLTRDGVGIDRTKCDVCGECVEACPSAALEVIGRRYTVDEALEQSLLDRVFYEKSGGGVTLSGGEPASQPVFSLSLMERLRQASIHTALDTCGGVGWQHLGPLVERADLVLYDLKTFEEEVHFRHTGVPNALVLENARRIASLEKPMWIRTPIIPGCSDDEQNISHIADFIVQHLPTGERYDLLAFNKTCEPKYARLSRTFALAEEPLVPAKKMERLAEIARARGVENVRWSGFTS